MKLNKIAAVICISLTYATSYTFANEPIVDNFSLPIETTNERLPAVTTSEPQEAKKSTSPVKFLYDSLSSSVPKESGKHIPTATGNVDYSSYGLPSNNTAFPQLLQSSYKPEQNLELKPGQNVAITVAAGLMNRIKTNFKMVAIRTSDESAIIEADKGYIYITTNSLTPLGLMIYEESMPETAVSLVLQPDNTPPAMVDVDVQLSAGQKSRMKTLEKERKRLSDIEVLNSISPDELTASSHEQRLTDLLLPIARQDIPQGFSETSEVPAPFNQPCSVPIRQKVGQRFVGARHYIDVVVMYNQTDYAFQIKEEMCLSRDTLAVALIDQSILQPGQSNEVYIVRDKLYKEKIKKSKKRKQLSAEELGLTRG